jgi:hypothetical protein
MGTSKIVSLPRPKTSLLHIRSKQLAGSRSTRPPPRQKEGGPEKKAAKHSAEDTDAFVAQLPEKSKQLRLACAALSAEELKEWLLSHYLT